METRLLVSTSFQKTHTKAMKHIKEINGKDYEFDVTTLNIKVEEYNGFWGTDLDVTALIKCNGNESEFLVRFGYPAGDAYDYYYDIETEYLAEIFGESAEEIERDFNSWFNKHSDELEKDYMDMTLDYLYDDEECIQNMVLNHLIEGRSDDFQELLVSDEDIIKTVTIKGCFMYVPTFMDDSFNFDRVHLRNQFENTPYYLKGLPCDDWGRGIGKKRFPLCINTHLIIDVDIYVSKYLAENYEVGTGWDNTFEYVPECIYKFLEHANITTIKELRDYLDNNNYTLKLDEFCC